jgi:hypothetical protein
MWLRSTFLSYPTTFLTCKRTISSCLLATIEIVDRLKSIQVDVLCANYPSHVANMWLRSTFLSYPTTFLSFQRTVSSCLLAKVEVVDRPKPYQVDVLCVDYLSHQIVTCGYELPFYIIPLHSLLVRELHHLVSLPR